MLEEFFGLRAEYLCPRRQRYQTAAETSLVSDFPLSRVAHAWRQKEMKFLSVGSPTKNHLPSVRLPALAM